jgi:hypothetical protein
MNPAEEPHCQFDRMIKWIEDHEFVAAQRQGWFAALRYQACLHARHTRVIDYWHDWEAAWTKDPIARYPSFDQWRRSADSYTFELTDC